MGRLNALDWPRCGSYRVVHAVAHLYALRIDPRAPAAPSRTGAGCGGHTKSPLAIFPAYHLQSRRLQVAAKYLIVLLRRRLIDLLNLSTDWSMDQTAICASLLFPWAYGESHQTGHPLFAISTSVADRYHAGHPLASAEEWIDGVF